MRIDENGVLRLDEDVEKLIKERHQKKPMPYSALNIHRHW